MGRLAHFGLPLIGSVLVSGASVWALVGGYRLPGPEYRARQHGEVVAVSMVSPPSPHPVRTAPQHPVSKPLPPAPRGGSGTERAAKSIGSKGFDRRPAPVSAPDLAIVKQLHAAAGLVVFRVCVTADGTVDSVKAERVVLLDSDDVASLARMIRDTRFLPALRKDAPVAACIRIRFQLTPRNSVAAPKPDGGASN